jgi:hypothetical protein
MNRGLPREARHQTSSRGSPVSIEAERVNALETLITDLNGRLAELRGYL